MDIHIECIRDWNDLCGFQCGVPRMDQFIQGQLKLSVMHHYCQLYIVRYGEEVLALFALSFDSLEMDYEDKTDIVDGMRKRFSDGGFEYRDLLLDKLHYPALAIAYLAVNHAYQKMGLGRAIVEMIVERAQSQTLAGCQFLTVDALVTDPYNTYTFYSKCGFIPSEYPNSLKDTRRMFRMLYTE